MSAKHWKYTGRLEVGLEKALVVVLKRFRKNRPYLIDVVNNKIVVLQFVHGRMIEHIHVDNSFNFTLSLTFDDKEKVLRFLGLPFSKDFVSYEYAGASCYAFNFGENIKDAVKITSIIMSEVYLFDENDSFDLKVIDMSV